jgi:aldehyde dehydrogenase (NAD+)
MLHHTKFYINGCWVEPASPSLGDVVNPATEQAVARISLGSGLDVDAAVAAARAAFPAFSQTAKDERIALLRRIAEAYQSRYEDLVQAISTEIGAPVTMSRQAQVAVPIAHLNHIVTILEQFEFEFLQGATLIVKDPIGVVGMITPWNWPLNQIAVKVFPAIAAGCTMVLKPSEVAPLSAIIFAEIMDAAGTPAGVFNLVNGDGPGVGRALSVHPDVDMISVTGSLRAGVEIAKAAADTVKRVHQELGGKSANILLDDVDFERAVAQGVMRCFSNAGQSCMSPTRMLVPESARDNVVAIAKRTAESVKQGLPSDPETMMGPVVSKVQFDRIQSMIRAGIEGGATLVTGGVGRPAGLAQGYYVQPTIFADVTAGMRIAKEEIFGPVLSILSYSSEEEAIRIANDTEFGLAAYVQSADRLRGRAVAKKMRAGRVEVNYPAIDLDAPFGGYKQSGNGREWGRWGLEEFLEIKGIVGYEGV